MRIGIASILQESNTFSPVFTKYEDFNPVFGQAVLERHTGKLTEMGGFIRVLSDARATIVPICAAWAITANRLLRSDFAKLADRFEKELAKAEIDALLFAMHGAQTAEGEDDVEGALLGRAACAAGSGQAFRRYARFAREHHCSDGSPCELHRRIPHISARRYV
ncbi:MAG TPA: M81 family metallopeptidase [Bryobacteraceae bacterium]|nr:M81 family metallopeptidase [Bryobacteraceae bacterium]